MHTHICTQSNSIGYIVHKCQAERGCYNRSYIEGHLREQYPRLQVNPAGSYERNSIDGVHARTFFFYMVSLVMIIHIHPITRTALDRSTNATSRRARRSPTSISPTVAITRGPMGTAAYRVVHEVVCQNP